MTAAEPADLPPVEGRSSTVRILDVDWNDTRAVALRAEMDREIQPRYAGRGGDPEATARALAVDPQDIAVTALATAPDGQPVGMAALRRLAGDWEVKRVVVLAQARGQGVGRLLMTHLENFAVAHGARRLILQTGDRQPDAVALYRRLGYVPIPIYPPYTDAIPFSMCFEKVLVAPPGSGQRHPAPTPASPPVFEPVSADGAADPALREQLLDLWAAATNAGGAVGFVPPAPVRDIAATLDAALARVTTGQDSLGVLRSGDLAVGMGFLAGSGSALKAHWRTVLRVMIQPELQGTGAGTVLMTGLHRQAIDLGLEHLMLTIRDGLQLERFYERFGYTTVGRHPGAIRVAPGDDRDEIMLVARLSSGTGSVRDLGRS